VEGSLSDVGSVYTNPPERGYFKKLCSLREAQAYLKSL